MSVSSETNKVTYSGDGSTATFSTSFSFSSNDEITVTLVTNSTGAEATWTLGTQYTLTGAGTGSAGTLTVDTSPSDYTPASGKTLVIELKPAFTQTTSLPRGGTVSPKDTLEPMHDKRVRQLLYLKGLAERAVKVPVGETSGGNLPVSALRADKALIFNSSGVLTVSTDDYDDQAAAAATSAAASASSATAAASSTTAAASSASAASTSATASASSATSSAATAATLTGASSTTSLAIGTGNKAFTVSAGLGFIVGDWVLVTSNANPTVNYMHGPIGSYSSTTMTVAVDNVGGSGTLNDWKIRRSGVQGATGATGSTGSTGATGSASSDAELSAIAGLTSAAGKMIEFTGSGSAQVITVTTAGKALIDDASASAQRTTMGVAIGSDVAAYNADTLFADAADELTAGYSTAVHDAGTKASGTYTPDQDNGNIQRAINGGAHTLAPTVDNCAVIIQYTNNASAGTITTSGFTLVDGDDISTTNGDDFFFYLTKANGFSLLTVKALQ
jgi:hypothetical protein